MSSLRFVADGQTAEAVDPGECALDDPAVLAQPLAALDTAARDPVPDAAPGAGTAAAAMIYGHFRPLRHLMTADQYRRSRNKAFRVWQETCTQTTV